jgi:putative transposase
LTKQLLGGKNTVMKIQRTITMLLEDDIDLRNTLVEFNRIQQAISPICFNSGKPISAMPLHKKCYSSVKGTLNSQMTCTALRLVAGAYSSAKMNKRPATKAFKFKRKTALFLIGERGRDASFHRSGKLSVWTIKGRKKLIFIIPEFFKPIFDKATSYDSLSVIETKGKLQGRLCLTLEVPDPVSASPVGVDLNETNAVVAIDANNKVFFKTGMKTKILNRRTRKVKKRLKNKLNSRKAENKNISSIVKVLKRLGKKEQRRTLDFARVTAKELCAFAGRNSVIVFEDLKFKQQKKYDGKSKATHRKLSAFPHALIRQCVTNRAELVGIGIEKVSPYNTSQICSKCGLIGLRKRHDFYCPHCDIREHADINAAVNIRNRFTNLRVSGLQSINPEALKVEANQQPCAIGS